jgi:hypothetical protein
LCNPSTDHFSQFGVEPSFWESTQEYFSTCAISVVDIDLEQGTVALVLDPELETPWVFAPLQSLILILSGLSIGYKEFNERFSLVRIMRNIAVL